MVSGIYSKSYSDFQQSILSTFGDDEEIAKQLIEELELDNQIAEFQRELKIQLQHARYIGYSNLERLSLSYIDKVQRAKTIEEISELKTSFKQALQEQKEDKYYKILKQEALNRALRLSSKIDGITTPLYESPISQTSPEEKKTTLISGIRYLFPGIKSTLFNVKKSTIDYNT